MPGPVERLAPDQAFRRSDPDRFDVETTDELDATGAWLDAVDCPVLTVR